MAGEGRNRDTLRRAEQLVSMAIDLFRQCYIDAGGAGTNLAPTPGFAQQNRQARLEFQAWRIARHQLLFSCACSFEYKAGLLSFETIYV
jgi:hypothetical protein